MVGRLRKRINTSLRLRALHPSSGAPSRRCTSTRSSASFSGGTRGRAQRRHAQPERAGAVRPPRVCRCRSRARSVAARELTVDGPVKIRIWAGAGSDVIDLRAMTAACVQAEPVVLDRDATLEKLSRLTAEAAENGATLVVFPEAFVPVYPSSVWAKALAGLVLVGRQGGFRGDRSRGRRCPRPRS